MEPSVPSSPSRSAPSSVHINAGPVTRAPTSATTPQAPLPRAVGPFISPSGLEQPALSNTVPADETQMNARLAHLLSEAGSRSVSTCVSRDDLDVVNRRLLQLERHVTAHISMHNRHQVGMNETRSHFGYMLEGERRLINDLFYDARELRAELQSVNQQLITLSGMLQDYVGSVDPERNLDATRHLSAGIRRLVHHHRRAANPPAPATRDPDRPFSPFDVRDRAQGFDQDMPFYDHN